MTRMDTPPRTFAEVARYLSRHLRRNAFIHAFVSYEAYALLLSAAALALVSFTSLQLPGLVIAAAPSAAAVAAAIWRASREDGSGQRVFRDADEAYGYHHLLPTAYEIHRASNEGAAAPDSHGGGSTIRSAILHKGHRHIQFIRAETVYPVGTPRRLFLLPLGALASLVIVLAAQGLDRSEAPNPWAGYVEELRNRSDAIARRSEALDDEEGARLAQQLDALSDTLEKRPERKEIEERLREVLPKLEDHMRNLSAGDLLAGAGSANGSTEGEADASGSLRARRVEEGFGDGLDLPPARRGGSDGSDGNAQDGETAADGPGDSDGDGDGLSEGEQASSETRAGESLSELGRELESAQEQLRGLSEQLRRRPGTEDGDTGNDAGQRSAEAQENEEPGSGPGDAAFARGRGGEEGEAGQGGGDEGSSNAEGGSRTPGIGDAPDLADEPGPRLSDVVRRMRELPSNAENSSFTELFSRETPGQARTEIQERQVNPSLQQQVETAVNRSSVPTELRGYVRDYFLRIANAANEPSDSGQGR